MGRYDQYWDRTKRSPSEVPTRPLGATGSAGGGATGMAEKTVEQALEARPHELPEEFPFASSSASSRRKDTHELPLFKRFIQQNGTSLEEALGFTYHGILVSNFTPQWMHIRGPEDYFIPPQTYGVQIPVYDGSNKAWITWDQPPGEILGSQNTATFALVKFVENLVEPFSGTNLTGVLGSGNVLGTNVVQLNGVTIQSAGNTFDNGLATSGGVQYMAATPWLLNANTNFDRGRSMGPAADGLGVALVSQPSSQPSNANANNAVATVTLAAVAGQRHRVTALSASYTAVASVGALQIALSDATTTKTWNVPAGLGAGNPIQINLPEGGDFFAVNTNVTATLSASGAAGSIGQVNLSKLTT